MTDIWWIWGIYDFDVRALNDKFCTPDTAQCDHINHRISNSSNVNNPYRTSVSDADTESDKFLNIDSNGFVLLLMLKQTCQLKGNNLKGNNVEQKNFPAEISWNVKKCHLPMPLSFKGNTTKYIFLYWRNCKSIGTCKKIKQSTY